MSLFYQDEYVVVYNDRWENVLPGFEDGFFECTITDPPYNAVDATSGHSGEFKKRKRAVSIKGSADTEPVDVPLVADNIIRVTKGSFYVWCGDEQYSQWHREFRKHGLTTRKAVWHKTNPSPLNGQTMWLSAIELCVFARKRGAYFSRFCEHPVWEHATVRNVNHPTPKPVAIMEAMIDASCSPEGVVLDCFGGGGSTAVAAKKLKRRCVIIEMDEQHCNEIVRRVRGV